MDTPRKWQVASVATAVASMSLGGLLLARPTSEAVAPIELDGIVDGRELSLASPTDEGGSIMREGRDDHRIVTPAAPSSIAEVAPPPAPEDATGPTTGSTSTAPSRSSIDADDSGSPDNEADDIDSPDDSGSPDDSIDSP